jgi:DMSO reductase anchor subunit
MHPALSVIVFTTVSGAGLGLLAWFGIAQWLGPLPLSREIALVPLALGVLLLLLGLASAFMHLGQPRRAWRAFSQWRTSWLSREAVAATLTLGAGAGMAACVWWGASASAMAVAAASLATLALATVVTTAGIYFSLRPIPAWHNAYVAPTFLLAALLSGAAWWWTLLSFAMWHPSRGLAIAFGVGALAFATLKLAYWRHIDQLPRITTAAAVGLPARAGLRPAEAPHTEANYLLREMGYVLARRHARRLRAIALVCAGIVPAGGALSLLVVEGGVLLAAGVTAALMVGLLVERWLFFAEARHVVTAYYC